MASVEDLQKVIERMESKMKLMELSQSATTAAVTNTKSDAMEVMAVALKLPLFYEDKPEMWFFYAESQFRLRHIKEDQTQFDHIWQSLTPAQALRVESCIANPLKTGQVKNLKEKLLTIYGRTQYEKDNELLNHGPLGDMTVLEFVGKMESLNKDPATFMKAFLLNKLPADVRGTISNTEFSSLTDLAVAADKVIKAQKKTAIVSQVEDRSEQEGEVEAVAPRTKSTFSSKGRGGQAKAPGKPKSKGTCFYHEKHGPAAFKCEGNGCVWSHIPLANRPPSGNDSAGR